MSRSGDMPARDAPQEHWGYATLLGRCEAFRDLWLGKIISLIGDWFNMIALYAAVGQLTTSARAVALVVVVKTLPIFLMAPLSGPLIDRFDRRSLLIASDVFRALCALGLIVAHRADSVVALYGVMVLMVCATGVALPTANAALPMLVPRARVAMANALMGGSWSIMLALGAMLGGVATEFLGVTTAFAIDAGTFVASVMLFVRLPALPPDQPGAASAHVPTGFRDGLRYLGRTRYVLSITLLKPLMQLYGGINALLPLYGTVVFRDASGALYIGILYAVRGVGSVIGSLVVRAMFGDAIPTMRRLILAAYVMAGASFAALSMCTAFWQAALAFFASAVGQSAIWVFSGSLLQLEADRRFHGRVFAIEFGLAMLILAGSSFMAGALIDRNIPLDRVVLGFSGLALVPAVLWGAIVWRTHRRAPGRARSGQPG